MPTNVQMCSLANPPMGGIVKRNARVRIARGSIVFNDPGHPASGFNQVALSPQTIPIADFADPLDAAMFLQAAIDLPVLQGQCAQLQRELQQATADSAALQKKIDAAKSQVLPMMDKLATDLASSAPDISARVEQALTKL